MAQTALVTALLTGSYRSERNGKMILSEPLPARMPCSGDDAAREAWARLVAAAACRERGAVDLTIVEFARRFHEALTGGCR